MPNEPVYSRVCLLLISFCSLPMNYIVHTLSNFLDFICKAMQHNYYGDFELSMDALEKKALGMPPDQISFIDQIFVRTGNKFDGKPEILQGNCTL